MPALQGPPCTRQALWVSGVCRVRRLHACPCETEAAQDQDQCSVQPLCFVPGLCCSCYCCQHARRCGLTLVKCHLLLLLPAGQPQPCCRLLPVPVCASTCKPYQQTLLVLLLLMLPAVQPQACCRILPMPVCASTCKPCQQTLLVLLLLLLPAGQPLGLLQDAVSRAVTF